MNGLENRVIPIRSSEDVVHVRQAVRALAVELGFNLVEQTKVVTAASELARNAYVHGGGGEALLDVLAEPGGRRHGLRLRVHDEGPGIPNIELAMSEGYSTTGGLGLGLSGARKLSHEFKLESAPGEGTRICIVRWR